MVLDMETVTLEEAGRIVAAAEEKAREIGQPMDIAVVDAGGNLKAFARMDGAWLGSISIAIDKAFTSASFTYPTRNLANLSQPGQPLFGINTTSGGRIVTFAGGLPLEREGDIVGAVGVSGGSVEQDQEVAEAGAAALQRASAPSVTRR